MSSRPSTQKTAHLGHIAEVLRSLHERPPVLLRVVGPDPPGQRIEGTAGGGDGTDGALIDHIRCRPATCPPSRWDHRRPPISVHKRVQRRRRVGVAVDESLD